MRLKWIVLFVAVAAALNSAAGSGEYNPVTCFARGLVENPTGFTARHTITEFMSNKEFCSGCTIDRAPFLPALAVITADEGKVGYTFELLPGREASPCPCDPDVFWRNVYPEYKEFQDYTVLSCFNGLVCGATLVFDSSGTPYRTFEPFMSDTVAIQSTFPFDFFAELVEQENYAIPTMTSERVPEQIAKYRSNEAPPRLLMYNLDETESAEYIWSFGCDIDLERPNLRWVQLMYYSTQECLTSGVRWNYRNSEYLPRPCRTRNDCYIESNLLALTNDIAFIKTNAQAFATQGRYNMDDFSGSEYWTYSAQCYTDERTCVTTVAVAAAEDVIDGKLDVDAGACPRLGNEAVLGDYIPYIVTSIPVTKDTANSRFAFFPDLIVYDPCMYPTVNRDAYFEATWDAKDEFWETCQAYLGIEYDSKLNSVEFVAKWDGSVPPIGPAPSVTCHVIIQCASGRKIVSRETGIDLVFVE